MMDRTVGVRPGAAFHFSFSHSDGMRDLHQSHRGGYKEPCTGQRAHGAERMTCLRPSLVFLTDMSPQPQTLWCLSAGRAFKFAPSSYTYNMDTQKTAIKSRPASAYRPFRWVRNFKKRWVFITLTSLRMLAREMVYTPIALSLLHDLR